MNFRSKIAPLLDEWGALDGLAYAAHVVAKRDLTILMYHRIAVPGAQPYQSDRLISATPDEFEEQMRWISSYASPIGFSDLDRDNLPRRAVIVTFDDGYLDNYLHAFPILKRYGIQATIYLVTGAIGSNQPFWWDAVASAMTRSGKGKSEIAKELERLKQMEDPEREKEADRIVRGAGLDPDRFPRSVLNWDEVREMSREGIDFGGHTIRHPILTRISEDCLRDEIGGCKKQIEEATNKPVLSFAYPVGRAFAVNETAVNMVRTSGYPYAVTTSYGRNVPGVYDPHRLSRIGIGLEDSISRFKAKVLAPQYFAPRAQDAGDGL